MLYQKFSGDNNANHQQGVIVDVLVESLTMQRGEVRMQGTQGLSKIRETTLSCSLKTGPLKTLRNQKNQRTLY